jgi:large conductance mechanosensitive channel
MRDVFKGFRDFIMRGNVVDLAVGVVIGVAFSGLVETFTDSLLKPLINLIAGGGVGGGKFTVREQEFDWAAVVNGLINFILIAAVVYFLVVLPMNKFSARFTKEKEVQAKEEDPGVKLLTEIRDELRSGAGRRPADS